MRYFTIIVLLVLILPRLAVASVAGHVHPVTGTSVTLTCNIPASTTPGGTDYDTDIFTETLTGNTTYTLPGTASNCPNRAHIELLLTQGTNQAFTVTLATGVGATVVNTRGVRMPASSGGATNAVMHVIFIYNTVPSTPEWETVFPPNTLTLSACDFAFAGTTADVQINAALNLLPAGGVVDARCYGDQTQTIAATVTFGNNIPHTLIVARTTVFNCTITNGTPCFKMFAQSSIVGEGEASAGGGFGITLANGANVDSEIKIDNSTGGNGSVENIALNGNSAATVANGLLFLFKADNIVTIRGVQTTGNGSPIMFKLLDVTGPAYFENDYADCGHPAALCTPVVIQNDNGGVGTNEITFEAGVYAHPGSTVNGNGETPIIDVQDLGGNNSGISFKGLTIESSFATDVGFNLARCASCSIEESGCSNGGLNGKTCVKIYGVSNNITVKDLVMYNAWTNTLVNTAANPTSPAQTFTQVSTPNIVYYNYSGFTGPGQETHTTGNGTSYQFDNTGLKTVGGTSFIVAPAALASFGTCDAAHEGGMATQTNSTAACVASATATTAGTTHCQVYCNGTNWIQTGR